MALEWPSSMSTMVSPSSYSSAFDMGYDMVAECGTDTILAYNSDGGKDEPQLTKFKVISFIFDSWEALEWFIPLISSYSYLL